MCDKGFSRQAIRSIPMESKWQKLLAQWILFWFGNFYSWFLRYQRLYTELLVSTKNLYKRMFISPPNVSTLPKRLFFCWNRLSNIHTKFSWVQVSRVQGHPGSEGISMIKTKQPSTPSILDPIGDNARKGQRVPLRKLLHARPGLEPWSAAEQIDFACPL